MKRFQWTTRGVGTGFLLLALSCAPASNPVGQPPTWPYPSFEALAQGPSEVVGFPDGLSGRWLAADPFQGGVLVESIDPRYFARYLRGGVNRGWYDLGFGTQVESLIPTRSGNWILVARYYGSFEEEAPVTARALLEVDLDTPLLQASTPMAVNQRCQGLVFDDRKNRAFLLQTSEDGYGVVELVDLYRGTVHNRLPVGVIPPWVQRRGLAFSQRHLELAVLIGGAPDVSDFAPQDSQEEGQDTSLLILSSETLELIERITLPQGYEPRSVMYAAEEGEMVLLLSKLDQSLVLTVNLDFHSVEHIVEVQGRASDMVLVGSTALVPTDRGLFGVDLTFGNWELLTLLRTEQAGEMAVSRDGATLWLRIFESRGMDQPGLLEFDLASGQAYEVEP